MCGERDLFWFCLSVSLTCFLLNIAFILASLLDRKREQKHWRPVASHSQRVTTVGLDVPCAFPGLSPKASSVDLLVVHGKAPSLGQETRQEEPEGLLRWAVHRNHVLGVGQLDQRFDETGSVFQCVDLKRLCPLLFPETSDSWSFLRVVRKLRLTKAKDSAGLSEMQGLDFSEEDICCTAPAFSSPPLPQSLSELDKGSAVPGKAGSWSRGCIPEDPMLDPPLSLPAIWKFVP